MQLISNTSVTYSPFFKYSEKVQKNAYSKYELSNHLGNVLAVITDRRIQTCGMGDVMHYEAQVVSISDYYPFGMGIKDREWKDSTFSYRFGFNGKEKDNEVSGEGNTMAFEARIYNSRLGRFFSCDPWENKYAWQTPYAYFRNCPISILDFLGKGDVGGEEKAESSTKKSNTHKVKSGDNVWNICKSKLGSNATNAQINDLMYKTIKLNNLNEKGDIKIGQVLIISDVVSGTKKNDQAVKKNDQAAIYKTSASFTVYAQVAVRGRRNSENGNNVTVPLAGGTVSFTWDSKNTGLKYNGFSAEQSYVSFIDEKTKSELRLYIDGDEGLSNRETGAVKLLVTVKTIKIAKLQVEGTINDGKIGLGLRLQCSYKTQVGNMENNNEVVFGVRFEVEPLEFFNENFLYDAATDGESDFGVNKKDYDWD